MGKNAYNKLNQWYINFLTITEVIHAASQPKPEIVPLEKGEVAQVLAKHHWIIIPKQCIGNDTLPAHTINLSNFFPPDVDQNIKFFAKMIGFKSVEDRDPDGKNIFHILFSTMKYCWVACTIAKRAFGWGGVHIDGCYAKALSQPIEHGPIWGYTPLHILCNNSDIQLASLDVVKALIYSKVVSPDAFASQRNKDVSVFSFWNTVCHESALGQLESWGDVSKRRQGC